MKLFTLFKVIGVVAFVYICIFSFSLLMTNYNVPESFTSQNTDTTIKGTPLKQTETTPSKKYHKVPFSETEAKAETTPTHPETATTETEPIETTLPETVSAETAPQIKTYPEGQYKIGTDLPAGVYVLIQNEERDPYFALTSDANGKEYIENDNFGNIGIIEAADGEYLELRRCYAIALEDFQFTIPENNILPEGAYLVGTHIPAGEYKLESTEDYGAYVCVYESPRREKIVFNDNFKGSRYAVVEEGQILLLNRGIIYVPEFIQTETEAETEIESESQQE